MLIGTNGIEQLTIYTIISKVIQMYAEDFVELLDGKKEFSMGQWKCQCPAHEDNVSSLTVTDGDDKVLFYCHARCDWRDVIEAMKIRPSQLYHGSAHDANWDYCFKPEDQPEAIYSYLDENGVLV